MDELYTPIVRNDSLVKRLTSRKFLLALAAFLTTAFSGNVYASAAVAAIYILAEAVVDRGYANNSLQQTLIAPPISDDPDDE